MRVLPALLIIGLNLALAPACLAFTAPSDVYVPEEPKTAPSAGTPEAAPAQAPARTQAQVPAQPQNGALHKLPPNTPMPKSQSAGISKTAGQDNIRNVLSHINDTRVSKVDDTLRFPKGTVRNSLITSVGSSLTWGSHDGQLVAHHLGIPFNQVPQICNLIFKGTIATTKGSYPFNITPENPAMNVGFNGEIKSILAEVFASCPMTQKLPAHAGTIFQSGNQYQVSLKPIACEPPKVPVSKLNISYGGNNKGSCDYE